MRTHERNRLGVARDAVHNDIQQPLAWLDNAIQQRVKTIAEYIDRRADLQQKRELLNSILGIGERTGLSCWRFMRIRSALPTAGKPPLLPGSIR